MGSEVQGDKTTLVVNLYGSPGVGKSTCASYIYSKLKFNHINSELVTEFAKDLVWENNSTALKDQIYILGNQSYKQSKLKGKVDVIITDSPIMLATVYTDEKLQPEYNKLACKIDNEYISINYFLIRDKPYNPIGRLQTETQSNELSKKIRNMLDNYKINYEEILANEVGCDKIIQDIIRCYRFS